MTDHPDNNSEVYAVPKRGLTLQECAFYHRLDIPGVRERDAFLWDLHGDEAAYLGNFDFCDKRVLEFGAANGALTFWMERQGADVVAMDLSPDTSATSWDILLPADEDVVTIRDSMAKGIARLNNGFWYAHEYYGSKAKLVHGTAYDVPRGIGKFDVVTLCAILLHLRDPFGALEHAMQFTKDALLIADLVPFGLSPEEQERSLAVVLPGNRKNVHAGITWWHITPAAYERYLTLRGFKVSAPTFGSFRQRAGERKMFQMIARRT